ncbi:S-layer homology domain-containing protein [Paenibacillus glycinis]|uniref:Glycoside hydrolase n=1 Tax=Paenibacillus glycinis TaxID=2697035 RepID=A0ABW9XKN6_9BACL|nr:S-layer homology domain-containing protein [Paenibacillus glycinis]NBD23162.1 glycoside hydrolase [Paenibacillus glycinis]
MIRKDAFRRTTVSFLLIMGMAVGFYPSASSAAAALPYDDIRNNYATEAIVNMTKLHFITGTGDRLFQPDKAISRAEFMTMIGRMLGIRPVSGAIPPFADVPKTAWYDAWVQPAIQLGLAEGTSPRTFEPNRAVTREEAAVILARALKQSSAATVAPPDARYLDQDRIASWAQPSVARLSVLGLIAGDENGNFRPGTSITRQDAAVLMNRAWTHPGWSDQMQSSPPATIQLGWQYAQTTAQFERQVAQSTVNTLSPPWYYLGKTGAIEDHADAALIAWAHQQGKQVWAMVGNHSDQAATHAMLSDKARRQAFVQQLAERVRKYGSDGLNVDFENVMPQDRDDFTAFITALHQQLTAVPAVLSVNVSPDLGSDWTEVFDYEALGKNADYVVLMGYDEHWGGDPVAGSVSSLPWLRQGLSDLLLQVPADKTILAVPLYTRDWQTSAGGAAVSAEIDLLRQNSLVLSKKPSLHWDERLGQYVAQYGDKSAPHRIWLEDGRSLTLKTRLGDSYSLAGTAYWYMGGESSDIWTSLRNAMRYDAYDFSA